MKGQKLKVIEQFQCPGCGSGGDTDCGQFEMEDSYGFWCKSHVLGTSLLGGPRFALGMPVGFNKPPRILRTTRGLQQARIDDDCVMSIRFWVGGEKPEWNHLNIPVWAMEQDGFLFVRTVAPRIGQVTVDVIEGGTLAMCPQALDVSEFASEID